MELHYNKGSIYYYIVTGAKEANTNKHEISLEKIYVAWVIWFGILFSRFYENLQYLTYK